MGLGMSIKCLFVTLCLLNTAIRHLCNADDSSTIVPEFAPHVSATCKAGTMNIKVKFDASYTGAVHARDFRTTSCMALGDGTDSIALSINLLAKQGTSDYCGVLVSHINGSNRTEERSIQLAVRMHKTLELADDKFYVITCGKSGFSRDDNSHVILKFLENDRRVRETVQGREYKIRAEFTKPNDTNGIRVVNCFAFDRKNLSWPLIDEIGCPIDSNLITRFTANSDGTYADAIIHSMFKFPDDAELHLQCDVIHCMGQCIDEEDCSRVAFAGVGGVSGGGGGGGFTKGSSGPRKMGPNEEGTSLAGTTVYVVDPDKAPLTTGLCEDGIRPPWLLWLTITLGILFLIMLLMNIFLCTAMSCSCANTEIIEKEPSIIEEYDPYRSWHGSQYGSRYSLHGRDAHKGYTSGGSTIHSNRSDRWRGSIYKLVWLDLAAFLFVYYVLNIIYRFALNPYQKTIFEAVVQYCYNYSTLIPLSFVLGFYVSIVMTRWWNQYISIPWPDPIAVFVSANIHGQDERGRVMRRTVMRYVCLCLTMVLTNVSPRVKKRFPHLNNLVEAGLLNENEKEIIESMNKGFPRHSKHWLPIVWAASIVTRARKEGRIRDDFAVKTIIDELNKFRGQCGLLISYDTISVPLVYTQVVTLAVYSYFLCSVMGQQWTEGKVVANSNFVNKIDLYFPVFTTLEFFFYMGWLKVAESLINPFGEDDDDFEVNWMVDRNLQVSYLIVDEMHHEHPELIKDQYWDEIFPNELPYTVASERFREEHPEPSTAKIEVSKTAAMSTTMSGVRIDDMVGTTVTTTPTVEGNKLLPSTSIEQSVLYKFPDGIQEEEADDTSGIHFTAGNVKTRPGSSPSLVSLSGTISRVNTVASALKRLLSRDDSRTGSVTPIDGTEKQYRFPGSVSGTSLVTNVNANKPSDNVRRIANEVIEEVDEQTTITSQKGANDNSSMRPNVRDIFNTKSIAMSSIQKTDPVVYFDKNKIYTRTQSNVETNLLKDGDVDALLLSSSAPATGSPTLAAAATPLFPQNSDSTRSLYDERNKPQSAKSIKNSCGPKSLNFKWFLSTVEGLDTKSTSDITEPIKEIDDFDKLKAVREKERTERQNKLIVRSISTVTGGEQMASPTTTVPSNIVTPSSSHLLLLSSSSAHTTISPEMTVTTVTTATTATAATIKTITTNSSSQLTEPGIE